MLSYIVWPFAKLLMLFYDLTGSYALALFGFSLVIKLILFPFYMKGKKGMMKMSRLSAKVKELEKKYEGNQQKYSAEVQKLYKEENVNPMSGCIWNLIPFPILLLLYSIIRHPITKLMGIAKDHLPTIAKIAGSAVDYTTAYGEMNLAAEAAPFASKITAAGIAGFVAIDFTFLGLNLDATPRFLFFTGSDPWHWAQIGLWLIPIISGALSLLQSIISQKMNPTPTADAGAKTSNKTMLIMMPLISIWIGFAMPAAMSIYWITNSILGIVQDIISTKHYQKVFAKEDAEKIAATKAREAAFEEKRRVREEKIAETGSTYRDKNTSKKKIQKSEKTQAETAEREYKVRTGQIKTSQVGDRPFARGRAYDPNRYASPQPENESPERETPAPVEESAENKDHSDSEE